MIAFITNYIYFGIINLISKRKIIICDIDNTIAQSVDSYGCNLSFSERKSILELVRFVKSKIEEGYYLYFFTVRPLSEYNTTLFWLRNNGFVDIKFFQLFMARNPMQKVNLLSKLILYDVIFIDDMSFGQEFGQVIFYTKEIDLLSRLKHVKYYGYSFIDSEIKKGNNFLLKNKTK
jgi:hypothetical protein